MYKIVVDRIDALIRLDMEGMLTPVEADRLVADLMAQVAGARLPRYALIVDVSRCPVQAQDFIASMATHLTQMKGAHAVAIVTGGMLARLQVARLFTQPFTRFVDTYAAALAWVLSGLEPDAPAAAVR